MVTLAKQAKERTAEGKKTAVHIVTLGPLTNLAAAIRESPTAFEGGHVRMHIMGGCGSGRGNVTRLAEFNVHADPVAAAEVFLALSKKGAPNTATVYPWEMCVANALPWKVFDELVVKGGSDAQKFLASISKNVYDPNASSEKRSSAGAVICDALAVALAISSGDELVGACELAHVEVETNRSSLALGATVLDFGHCYDGVDRERTVRWVTGTDLAGVLADALRQAAATKTCRLSQYPFS
jgi:inosine-uridine nucleoside N-ribohydrolase